MRISYSATQTYMRCHLQWHYRYVEGLERLTKAPPLITGELAHQALSCFYSTPTSARSQELLNHYLEDSYNDWLNANEARLALYPEELVKAEGARRRAAAMLKDYAAFAQVHDTFTVIATEAKLNFPWHDFEVGFAADGLIEQEGVRYLLEHKTTALYNPQSYQTDWQMPLYIWMLSKIEGRWEAGGEVPPPKFPEVSLIPGEVSGALYNTIELRSGKPSYYRDLLLYEKYQIGQVVDDFEQVAWEMKDAMIYPNPMFNCHRDCPYRELCLGRTNGWDVEYLKEQLYERRKDGS